MQAIQFESVVSGDVITIPVRYRNKIRSGSKVKVFTSVPADSANKPKAKAGALSANDFIALKIDTRLFKFNREEANERH